MFLLTILHALYGYEWSRQVRPINLRNLRAGTATWTRIWE